MDLSFIAAIIAVFGFTSGDIFTAIATRKITANKAVLIITLLKTLIYVPFIFIWRDELSSLNFQSILPIFGLGLLFAISYRAFFTALEIGNATIVGVIAGVFPAIASLVSIIFLGERPSLQLILLLISVISAAVYLGLLSSASNKLVFDRGTKLALFVMIAWGFCFGLRKYPIDLIGTPHAWLIVQFGIALTMTIVLFVVFRNHALSSLNFKNYSRNVIFIIFISALAVGIGEGSESLALATSHTTPVAIVSGSYPALYAILSRIFFKDPVSKKQWLAIGYIAIAIVMLGFLRS